MHQKYFPGSLRKCFLLIGRASRGSNKTKKRGIRDSHCGDLGRLSGYGLEHLSEATQVMEIASFFILSAVLLQESHSADILAVFPHTGKSHYFMFQPFVYKLAERGHKITVLTHFPDAKPPKNINFVSLESPDHQLQFNSFDLQAIENTGNFPMLMSLIGLYQFGVDACETGLSHPNVQALLKKHPKFDLAIVEFFNTDCFASLARYFDVPLVGIFSSVMMPWHNGRFGNPDNPAYISNHFLGYPSRMNFLQRTSTTLATVFSKILYELVYNSAADASVRKYVGEDLPPVAEIVKNSSLFLVNTHFTLFQPRPLVPGIIELGGFHVSPPKGNIPADVLKFIENSPNGVVFFSMGSTVRGSTMPEYRMKIFQQAFSKLGERVIWKWEDDQMIGKPDNVLIGKWFPQNEILAHPKVKLFITHSGLMGTEEAVYHGVPMLMIPLFGDQPVNAASCAEKGIGVVLNYYTLNEEQLTEGLKTVLQNKSYSENAKKLSKMFLDRPLSILDTAIYWTEYVIRYQGAPQLQSAAVHLTWYQEYLLDVFAFLLIVISSVIYVTKKLFVCLFCKSKKVANKLKKS